MEQERKELEDRVLAERSWLEKRQQELQGLKNIDEEVQRKKKELETINTEIQKCEQDMIKKNIQFDLDVDDLESKTKQSEKRTEKKTAEKEKLFERIDAQRDLGTSEWRKNELELADIKELLDDDLVELKCMDTMLKTEVKPKKTVLRTTFEQRKNEDEMKTEDVIVEKSQTESDIVDFAGADHMAVTIKIDAATQTYMEVMDESFLKGALEIEQDMYQEAARTLQSEISGLRDEASCLTQICRSRRQELKQIEENQKRRENIQESTKGMSHDKCIQCKLEKQMNDAESMTENISDVKVIKKTAAVTQRDENLIKEMSITIKNMEEELERRLQEIQKNEVKRVGVQKEQIEVELRTLAHHERGPERRKIMEMEKQIILLKECMLMEINQLNSKSEDTNAGYMQRMEQLITKTVAIKDRVKNVTDKAVQTVTKERLEGEMRQKREDSVTSDMQVEEIRTERPLERASTSLHVVMDDGNERLENEAPMETQTTNVSQRRRLLQWVRERCCRCPNK
ncbi:hypothetical protein HF521_015529, partial [Silurus meridionalis]